MLMYVTAMPQEVNRLALTEEMTTQQGDRRVQALDELGK
jgi:hypothetical protein